MFFIATIRTRRLITFVAAVKVSIADFMRRNTVRVIAASEAADH